MLLFLFLFLSSLLVQVTVRKMLRRTVRVSTITNLTLTKDSWPLNLIDKKSNVSAKDFCITRGGVEEKDRGTVPGTV